MIKGMSESTDTLKGTNILSSVAAVILTYNEEKNIEACLRSLTGFCEEIYIVDSGSTDETLDICRRYTDKIHSHPFIDCPSQWSWAMTNIPLGCRWMMALDADYILTEGLKRQIAHVVSLPESDIRGYFLTIGIVFRGKRLRSYGMNRLFLRLFDVQHTRVGASVLDDHRFIVQGRTRILTGLMLHDNRNENEIDFYIDKQQVYSTRLAAEEVLRSSGRIGWIVSPYAFGNPDQRVTWLKRIWQRLPLFWRPFFYFVYRYIVRLGFLDGWNGFLFDFLHAFWFRLIVDVKIMDMRRKIAAGTLTMDDLERKFRHSYHNRSGNSG
jgi:glycosyltransferase involved in cell wall biosynthesis